MSLSRRNFVRTLGWGSAATMASGSVVSARGREALGEFWTAEAAAPGAFIRLDSNENPNGPGAVALDAIRNSFDVANRYARSEVDDLTKAIAAMQKVSAENVLLGCGSGEILRISAFAFASPTRHLVNAAPTFESPARDADMLGYPVRSVPVDGDLKLDLARMEAAAPGSGLIFICNPNNPTATVHGAKTINDFVARVAKASPETVVLIDEAYHEYVDDPTYATAIPLAMENKNVVVSRTFSKVYGMAGLRAGYAIAHPDTIGRMRKFKLQNGVNQLVLAGALASLNQTDRIAGDQRLNRAARDYTRRLFESMGCKVAPSETNFVMVDIRRDSKAFQAACRAAGVLVGRPFPPLNTHARVSIGTMDEMQRASEVFKKILGASTTTAGRVGR